MFSAPREGRQGLSIRPMNGLEVNLLPGTSGATSPFWSPDSLSIGYVAGGGLWRIDANGGQRSLIANVNPISRRPFWTTDGTILFTDGATRGLWRVSVSGGKSSALTQLQPADGEVEHSYPQILPDGRMLYWARSGKPEGSGVYITTLQNPDRRTLVARTPAPPLYAANHLLWQRGTEFVGQRFDPDRLQMTGTPGVIATGIPAPMSGERAASGSDRVLTISKGGRTPPSQFVLLDRTGRRIGSLEEPGVLLHFRLSPDGRRIAVNRPAEDSRMDMWLVDIERNVWTRATFARTLNGFPVWSPDGSSLLFQSGELPGNLYRMKAGGAGEPEPITALSQNKIPSDWSRDSRWILYSESFGGQTDLRVLAVGPDSKPEPGAKARTYLQTPHNERTGRFSPERNPRWIAYQSDESGRNEIYIQSFPEPRGKIQISAAGGTYPEWNSNGREIFFLSAENDLMSVSLAVGGDSIQPGLPRKLFRSPGAVSSTPFSASPDGNRFLVRVPVETDGGQRLLHVIVNWTALLRKGE